MMREGLQHRLEALREEFEKGQKQLREMLNQQNHLQETLLRISGAIQVLEEELAKDSRISGDVNGSLADSRELSVNPP